MPNRLHKIAFLPSALDDLEKITHYIADTLGAPQAARKFIADLDVITNTLAHFPYACPVYAPRRPLDAEIRYTPIDNFLLFYLVNKQTVEILHVRYGRQNPADFLSNH
ncbi:MAG: type II toxin-antitoxin system RelE/ParE family toxin [Candidatus Margulisbacteria bacterium]|jgi:plasmid stabilization system protein ParE|nr:type II toxin-antitoxin system RelE/ParE family toxin [Candidatus Margulisiibacteriota bacterium]